jgi:hypothetical protein
VSLPVPEPGLVIRYNYLWNSEFRTGRSQSDKDRPCAIILAVVTPSAKQPRVIVVPVTHSEPRSGDVAMELPATVKRRLGLDADRSWLVLDEHNEFDWPGPDLRRIGDQVTGPFSYGVLPPAFFQQAHREFMVLVRSRRSKRVQRTE